MGHFSGGTAMSLVVPFAMGLVASSPCLPMWSTAQASFWSCRPILVGPDWSRAGFTLRMVSIGFNSSSIGTSGQRLIILPVSDRTTVGYRGIRVCRRGSKGPMGRGSGGSMGGENLGMGGVSVRWSGTLKFAPRSLQAEKAKGQDRLSWPFSRDCQTYWEACQKCGGL